MVDLLKRAAYVYKQLVDCANYMDVGLDRALKTLATISPLMQELKEKTKWHGQAMEFLNAEEFAQRSRNCAIQQIEKNKR